MPVPKTSSPAAASAVTTVSKPVFFWKPHDGNGYLGQWYWSKFTVEGETYVTAEMWMMVQKARLFGDENIAKQILETANPRDVKRLGRQVKGFDEKVWDKYKVNIVTTGTYHKFTLSEDAENLRSLLLATGEREIVEASPQDRIWGVGFKESEAERNRYRWRENLLGRVLMDVRGRLREEGKVRVG